MTAWLLMDYGDVIARPFAEDSRDALVDRLGLGADELESRYWAGRRAYDAGQDAAAYWNAVGGRDLSDAEVADLVDIDRAGWAWVDPEMLDLLDEQAAAGTRLALLSNAPHFQADAFDALPWTDRFEHVFVSARLGLVKPDAEIFEHVLSVLEAPASDVTFVDDRAENVDAALALGIRGLLFTGVLDLRAALE